MKNRITTKSFTGLAFALFLMLSATTTKVSAVCQAAFTWSQTTNNVITFTDASTGISAGAFYSWDMGDGNNDWNQNPVHTYSIPGMYRVCMTVSDSMNGCTSTFCDSITVTGTIICNISLSMTYTMPSCPACTDGAAYCSVYNAVGTVTYLWNNGQTTNPATGLGAGTYSCCVADSAGCTACDTVVVTASTCGAGFTWAQTANNTIAFTDASTGTTPSTSYYWNFGDGNNSYMTNPTNFYSNPGTYSVCLSLSDSNMLGTCNSSICQTITVTGVNCFTASGVTLNDATCMSCSDGVAAIVVTSGTPAPPFTYAWTPAVGTSATVSGLAPGYYNVCMTDANGCVICSSVYVGSTLNCSAYFSLVADSSQQHTYWAVCNPMLNSIGTYYWSWGDGFYSTTQYPSHTYSAPGFYTICLTVTDSSGCTATYCDSMYLARMSSIVQINVVPSVPQGISSIVEPRSLNLFPNPVNGKMSISYTLPASSYIHIDLFDMVGNKIVTITDEMKQSGEQKTELDAAKLPAGIYFLRVKTNGNVITRKVSVLH